MTKVVKPLLADKADLDVLQYPVWGTPKLDGIRCLMLDGQAMSRSMKPIPNLFVQQELASLHGQDGELMLLGDYNEVQSGIMKQSGTPDFSYFVFDIHNSAKPYEQRIEDLLWAEAHPRIKVLEPVIINNEDELQGYLDKCLAEGYEGIMIRKPGSLYKYGRSTVKECTLLKVKKFIDAEGELIEVIEAKINNNELEADELGYAKRSSSKENLEPAGTAGSIVISWDGKEFRVGFGRGFTAELKQEIWDKREELKGELVKFSYQELSKDGIPRFGKMLSIRHPDDL